MFGSKNTSPSIQSIICNGCIPTFFSGIFIWLVVATFSSYDTKEFVVAGEMEEIDQLELEGVHIRRGFLTNKISGS